VAIPVLPFGGAGGGEAVSGLVPGMTPPGAVLAQTYQHLSNFFSSVPVGESLAKRPQGDLLGPFLFSGCAFPGYSRGEPRSANLLAEWPLYFHGSEKRRPR
jgi:hypothetical protein